METKKGGMMRTTRELVYRESLMKEEQENEETHRKGREREFSEVNEQRQIWMNNYFSK